MPHNILFKEVATFPFHFSFHVSLVMQWGKLPMPELGGMRGENGKKVELIKI